MRPYEELLSARTREIQMHMALITELNEASIARRGFGKLKEVETEHVEILKSGFLVHLYNVVEAVMDLILVEVARSAAMYPPARWSDSLRTEWVRTRAGVEVQLDSGQRLSRSKEILDEAINDATEVRFWIAAKGNWSHEEIVRVSNRLGCTLCVEQNCNDLACGIAFQDDMPPMKYVRHKRNRLSHGNETFGSGANQLSPDDLRRLQQPVLEYMSAVTVSYSRFLQDRAFLQLNAAA